MSPRFRLPKRSKGQAELAPEATTPETTAPETTPETTTPETTTPESALEPALAPAPAHAPAPERESVLAPVSPAVAIMAGAFPTPAPQPAPEPAPQPQPEPTPLPGAAAVPDALARLAEAGHALLSWIDDDGYPVNVEIEIEVQVDESLIRFTEPAGFKLPVSAQLAITTSHIHAISGGGYDQRSHATVWGVAVARPRGRFAVSPGRAWVWDDTELPLPAAYERRLPRARRYFRDLSAERGVQIRPRLELKQLLFRATRAPFLSATFAPVFVGLAVAARVGYFDALTAILTVVAASLVHFGLNVANDIFDTLQGADDANATPTMFSGGSRVIQNALVTIREMSMLAVACYVAAGAIGVALLVLRGSPELIAICAIGLFISLAYTMPPFKLVYRGLGEIATGIGFGPVMLLGAYVVQTRGAISTEAVVASLPIALLVTLILYVNEIPDRPGDVKACKRTLPVRWSKRIVILAFDIMAALSFVIVAAGVGAGVLPIPTLLALVAIPLAVQVHRGLGLFYENPYALMPYMAANIKMHMTVGLLMFVGYAITLADKAITGLQPFLWH